MIKKIVIVFCVVLGANYCDAQVLGKMHKKIAYEDIPLLFKFDKKITIFALTQSWIQVDSNLIYRAKYSMGRVAIAVLKHINAQTVRPKGNSYVLDHKFVCDYDKESKHKNYFLQKLLVLGLAEL
jgi:hypothetical protein